MDDRWSEVPPRLQERLLEIVDLTDAFCDQRLDDEYKEICRKMAVMLCRTEASVAGGKPASWASGIVYSAGWVNFLSDPSREPHLRSEEIAQGFGVSMATMQAKSKVIRESLGLVPFHPEYSLPRLAENNPLIWIVEINGMQVDLRHAPRQWQVKAFEEGLIPYVPADREGRPEE